MRGLTRKGGEGQESDRSTLKVKINGTRSSEDKHSVEETTGTTRDPSPSEVVKDPFTVETIIVVETLPDACPGFLRRKEAGRL